MGNFWLGKRLTYLRLPLKRPSVIMRLSHAMIVAAFGAAVYAFPSVLQPAALLEEADAEVGNDDGAKVTINGNGAPSGWKKPQIETFNSRGPDFKEDLQKLATVFAEEPAAASGSGDGSDEGMFGPSLKEYLTGNSTESAAQQQDKIQGMEDTIKKAKQIQKKMPSMEKKLTSLKKEYDQSNKAESQAKEASKKEQAQSLKASIEKQIKELEKEKAELQKKAQEIGSGGKGGAEKAPSTPAANSTSSDSAAPAAGDTKTSLVEESSSSDRKLNLAMIRNILTDLRDLV